MITLLGSLLGFLSAAFPDFLKLFRDAQDRKHELKILELQMQQQAIAKAEEERRKSEEGRAALDAEIKQLQEDIARVKQSHNQSSYCPPRCRRPVRPS